MKFFLEDVCTKCEPIGINWWICTQKKYSKENLFVGFDNVYFKAIVISETPSSAGVTTGSKL